MNKFTKALLVLWVGIAGAHTNQSISADQIEAQKNGGVSGLLNFLTGHKFTMFPELMNADDCQSSLPEIHEFLDAGHHTIGLHKSAMDCHVALGQDEQATAHQKQVLNLVSHVWDDQQGNSAENALWISDIFSAYQLLKLLDYHLVSGTLMLENERILLETHVIKNTTFTEVVYFDVSDFIKNYHSDETTHSDWNAVYKRILAHHATGYGALIDLAAEGMAEAQIFLSKLLIANNRHYPASYSDAISMLQLASETDHTLAKYEFAKRVFVDRLEAHYPQAHEFLNEAMNEKFLNAFVLGIVVRENALGIAKDQETIDALIQVVNLGSENPGGIEYQIYQTFNNPDSRWKNAETAKKYLNLAVEKNHVTALIEKGRKSGDHKQSHNPLYKQALPMVKNPSDAIKLGIAYILGWNTQVDQSKGLELLQTGGTAGSAASFYLLGLLRQTEDSEFYDEAKAAVAYQSAVDLGHHDAEIELGLQYLKGLGVEKDQAKGLSLLQAALKGGADEAALTLGAIYQQGIFVEPDFQLAKKYYLQANGKTGPMADLNMLFLTHEKYRPATSDSEFEDWLKAQFEFDDIAMIQTIYLLLHDRGMMFNGYHRKILKKLGKDGMHQAYLLMARYEKPHKSVKKVLKIYQKALDMGSIDAAYEMSLLMEKEGMAGWEALLKKAADQGHMRAMVKWAGALQAKPGHEEEALDLLLKAHNMGAHWVTLELVNLYLDRGDDTSVQKAIETLESMAADTDFVRPYRNLGEIFSNEHYLNKNWAQALDYLMKAASRGDEQAQLHLGKMYLWGGLANQNHELAMFFFQNLAVKRNQEGLFWLALMAEKGWNSEATPEEAIALYDAAGIFYHKEASANNRSLLICQQPQLKSRHKQALEVMKNLAEHSRTAAFNLGWMYEKGLCTRASERKAFKQYLKAAESGSPHAMHRLAEWFEQYPKAKGAERKAHWETAAKSKWKELKRPFLMTVLMPEPVFD